jgi:hypothetical protein
MQENLIWPGVPLTQNFRQSSHVGGLVVTALYIHRGWSGDPSLVVNKSVFVQRSLIIVPNASCTYVFVALNTVLYPSKVLQRIHE